MQRELREELLWSNEALMYEKEASGTFLDPESWYHDIRFYLVRDMCPEHIDASQRRALRLKSIMYYLVDRILYRKKHDGIWLRCLEKDDANHVLKEMHDGLACGHYGIETTAQKILRARYYWPTMFKDSHAYACKCKACQTSVGRERKPVVPLRPVMIYRPFQQWGLDVIGEITPNSSQRHKYILIVTNYFTRWTEAIPL